MESSGCGVRMNFIGKINRRISVITMLYIVQKCSGDEERVQKRRNIDHPEGTLDDTLVHAPVIATLSDYYNLCLESIKVDDATGTVTRTNLYCFILKKRAQGDTRNEQPGVFVDNIWPIFSAGFIYLAGRCCFSQCNILWFIFRYVILGQHLSMVF